jgi:hypothetical protein
VPGHFHVPASSGLSELHFSGCGVWFADKFMEAIQGYHLITRKTSSGVLPISDCSGKPQRFCARIARTIY